MSNAKDPKNNVTKLENKTAPKKTDSKKAAPVTNKKAPAAKATKPPKPAKSKKATPAAKKIHTPAKQLRFLSQSALLEESASPHIVSATMGLVCLILISFLAWAAVTHVDEVATSAGEVIPSGYLQAVQHPEGGVVSDITVEEGDFVSAGQLLLRLDEHNLRSAYERNEIRRRSLALKIARLRAFVNDKAPDFSAFADDFSSLADEEKELLYSMQTAREKKRNVLQDQIATHQHEMRSLGDTIRSAKENVELLTQEDKIRQDLVQRGINSKITSLESKRRLSDANARLREARNAYKAAEKSMKEAITRLESLDADLHEAALTELNAAETEHAELLELADNMGANLGRMDIRAPARGLVKGLSVTTIGGVVTPGQVLMEIVPMQDDMIVETKIAPRDVGHMDIGHDVSVKVSSYDYARYGAVQGTLASLSPSTYSDEQGNVFYKARVRLSQAHVGNDPSRNLILPGMTVQADVITGQKTVLEYLVKPIHLAMSSAFVER